MSAPGQDNQEKSANNILWGIAGVFFLMMIIWYFMGDLLQIWFIKFRLLEIQLISYFTDSLDILAVQINDMDPADLDWEIASYISQVVGEYLMYPVGAILIILACMVFFSNVGMRYKKQHTMETLLAQEKTNWPQITPVSKLDLVKEDIDKGVWGMAYTPLIFCKKYKIVEYDLVPDSQSAWKREPVAKLTLKKDDARRVFAKQLGPHWEGINKCEIYVRALFAVFAARINRDEKSARKLLDQLAATAAAGKPDYSGADTLLKKYVNTNLVQKVVHHHAYLYTVMASMLATARSDGVVAPADFLWLKAVDRRLWYILNTVGRQVAFAETAGPFAHWKAELEMGRALNSPFVEEAVVGMEMALGEVLYTPTDEEMQELIEKQQSEKR